VAALLPSRVRRHTAPTKLQHSVFCSSAILLRRCVCAWISRVLTWPGPSLEAGPNLSPDLLSFLDPNIYATKVHNRKYHSLWSSSTPSLPWPDHAKQPFWFVESIYCTQRSPVRSSPVRSTNQTTKPRLQWNSTVEAIGAVVFVPLRLHYEVLCRFLFTKAIHTIKSEFGLTIR